MKIRDLTEKIKKSQRPGGFGWVGPICSALPSSITSNSKILHFLGNFTQKCFSCYGFTILFHFVFEVKSHKVAKTKSILLFVRIFSHSIGNIPLSWSKKKKKRDFSKSIF